MTLSAPFQKLNFERRKDRGVSRSLCARAGSEEKSEGGKLSRKRGQREPSHNKKAGNTQVSNMKGMATIL